MAAEGEPPSSMSYIVHESTQKYKKKIIQNLADFAYRYEKLVLKTKQ